MTRRLLATVLISVFLTLPSSAALAGRCAGQCKDRQSMCAARCKSQLRHQPYARKQCVRRCKEQGRHCREACP
jgi:hypothetical protein